jgi:hypothetical protein
MDYQDSGYEQFLNSSEQDKETPGFSEIATGGIHNFVKTIAFL